jgi:hypothetical protein
MLPVKTVPTISPFVIDGNTLPRQYSSSCLFPPPLTSMAKSGQCHAPPETMLYLLNNPLCSPLARAFKDVD